MDVACCPGGVSASARGPAAPDRRLCVTYGGGKGGGTVRVGVVDDHPIVRYGISQVLGQHARIEVCTSVGSPGELSGGEDLDTVVLDLYLGTDEPDLAAVAALSAVTAVLVVSASARPADVVAAMRAGANGYLTKDCPPELLVGAVLTVGTGGFALTGELADILHSALPEPLSVAGGAAAAQVRLSQREEQTLRYIARGFTHDQVARRLGVSRSTVNTYVERIRDKLQVGNKAELTRVALARRGLVRDTAD